jgi:hypothetical protein
MTKNAMLTDAPPNPVDAERDRKLEVLLDELVTVPSGDELPPDFANRVLARRPYAPWEVSRAAYWRVPAGVGLGLLGGSLALALTPLWSLGPATAFTVWTELVAVAFGRPAATLVTAFPLLADGTGRAAQAVSPGGTLLVGSLAGVVGVSLGLALGRLRRPVASAIPRRG